MSEHPWYRSYDPGVPTEPDFEDRTLVENLARTAESYPDRRALVYFNRSLTYRELYDHVLRLASALRAMGVGPGTRVAVQSPNTPQFVIGYYAAMTAGGVAVPTNPIYTAREIEHQWNDCGCEVAILTDYIWAQKVRAMRDRIPVKNFIVAPIAEYMRFPLSLLAPLKLKWQDPALAAQVSPEPGVHFFGKAVAASPPLAEPARPAMDDVATLLYTGGTTGISKGAALTHRNLSYNAQQIRTWISDLEDGTEVMLGALPLFHSFGLTVVMNVGLSMGGAVVLLPNPRDIPAIVKSVEKHRITRFCAVPAQFNAITQHPDIDKVDLTSIKTCNSGAAPLPVDVLERFESMTGSRISEGFGLTETSPVTHSNPLKARKVGSIGVPLPGTEARIVDAETGEGGLPPGQVGELIVKGPQVMQGYWQKPDATAEMIRDGWLYTGDLARMDTDGFFFIEGRKKDMILCSGFNVYPDEIDRVLMAHEAVLEAATIGVPDEKRGETVKSFVVLKPGIQASAENLLAYCREELAAYKVPRMIEFLSELPKSSVMKILRRELRDRELQKRQ